MKSMRKCDESAKPIRTAAEFHLLLRMGGGGGSGTFEVMVRNSILYISISVMKNIVKLNILTRVAFPRN